MSTRKKLSAGDIVKTHCACCGKIREHKVIALIDETTCRVECSSCDSGQNYEKVAAKPKGKKPVPAKSPRPPRAKPDPAVAEQKEWVLLRPSMNIEQAVAYNMDGSYQTKTLLNHSAFGIGLVTRIAGPHKMEVLFECGKKLLRCH